MFLINWYREWCEVRLNNKHEQICESCETLKQQLEIANYEKSKLMDMIMEKPTVEKVAEPPQITRPIQIPWTVRRQMLEAEDRVKAAALKRAAKADAPEVKMEDLEKELDVAGKEREQTSNS